MKKICFALAIAAFLFFYPSFAFAQTICQPIYGGGETCATQGNISIDKKVLNPQTNKLVDNLGVNDPKYQSDFLLNFQISLTNTGGTTLNHVEVKDIFPQFTTFNAGPGNFDPNTKTLSFSINNLMPNETRNFIILGRVVSAPQLPSTQGVLCVVNQASAVSDDGSSSQDNSQFCIENKIPAPVVITKGGFPVLSPVPITSTPSTGPESLVLFSLIPTGITGLLLRKYSIKNNKEVKN